MSQSIIPGSGRDSSFRAPFLTPRRKLLIAGFLVALALAFFAFNAFQGATAYYLTVSELLQREPSDRTVRVNGKLIPDSYHLESGSTVSHFRLTDGSSEIDAIYDGAMNDLFFNPHSEIVLEGIHSPDGVFRTQTILVKCPSKYQSLTEEQST
jgi:cytochrome c-type biogenesis protein CcmE